MEKIIIVKDKKLVAKIDKPDGLQCYYLWYDNDCQKVSPSLLVIFKHLEKEKIYDLE